MERKRYATDRVGSETETKLKRIAWLSSQDPHKKFKHLMHHFNEGSLERCFHELDGKKAVGADGITKKRYGKALVANLKDLIFRMKQMAYRPAPVKEVLIPKTGVLRSGELEIGERGVVQGSACSPILSNIYAHYVLDNWFEEVVKRHCQGKVALFRYCDDGDLLSIRKRCTTH